MISGRFINNGSSVGTLSTQLNTSGTVVEHTKSQAGVMRLYAAENVVAYLTGVKGHSVNRDRDFNTVFSVYTDDNKTYRFYTGEFHYAMFEGEKVYITQNGRQYAQGQADRLAAKNAKEEEERLEREREYKINNFDSLAEKYNNLMAERHDILITQHYQDGSYKELLTQVLDIISDDQPVDLEGVFGLPTFVRKALYANEKKYKRRYK